MQHKTLCCMSTRLYIKIMVIMHGQLLQNSTVDFFITFNTKHHNQQIYIIPNTSMLYSTNQYHMQQIDIIHVQLINTTFNKTISRST